MNSVESMLENGFNLGMFREETKHLDDSTPIVMISDYGDRYHTEQALAIGNIDLHDVAELKESAYSTSGVALEENEDPRDEVRLVIALKH